MNARSTHARTSALTKLAVIGAPLLSLTALFGFAVPAWQKHDDLRSRVNRQRATLRTLQAEAVIDPKLLELAAPDRPEESGQFLGEVTALARVTGCQVAGLEGPEPVSTPATAPVPPRAVRPVKARVLVQGSFASIRRLLDRLARTERLYAPTELTIRRLDGRSLRPDSPLAQQIRAASRPMLEVGIRLDRYVMAGRSASGPPSLPGAVQPVGTGPSNTGGLPDRPNGSADPPKEVITP